MEGGPQAILAFVFASMLGLLCMPTKLVEESPDYGVEWFWAKIIMFCIILGGVAVICAIGAYLKKYNFALLGAQSAYMLR